jgi:hypothetical protein
MRSGLLCSLSIAACLLRARTASAEITLIDADGWTVTTDGRINAFVSQGIGDDFPAPNPNPFTVTDAMGMTKPGPTHEVNSANGFASLFYQNGRVDSYNATRFRNGFVGGILAFGVKRKVSESTSAKGYIALWGMTQTVSRDRTNDFASSADFAPAKGFDVREGWVALDGPWGTFTAGRMLALFGRISTEIDFNYGHNYGLGFPCGDKGDSPACGHIGTGVMFPGFGAGFLYSTPSFGGLQFHAALFDPVRILGGWNRASIARPEGAISFQKQLSPTVMLKLQGEALYQVLAFEGQDTTDGVWGVSAGGRLEVGPLRLGASVFRGKGLGQYYAVQNSAVSFSQFSSNHDIRYFTGLYGQTALVLGPMQVSAGVGRVSIDQLYVDQFDYGLSNAKDQWGVSAAFYYNVTDNFVLGLDYFRFQADWYGAPYYTAELANTDPNTGQPQKGPTVGYLPAEKQVINFINAGATFHW